jgi:ADP-L-glycero-D-manno-heptose 6-epimerase
MLFEFCSDFNIPFIYASSASTYGNGEFGFSDDLKVLPEYVPLNKYGFSKHIFDKWVLKQRKTPPFWAILKFFNVYGPQEYHKEKQSSVIYQAFNQIKATGALKLFKSYKSGVADGEQKRDFVYVKDVVRLMEFLLRNHKKTKSGVYNVGTGKARTFLDLGKAVFAAMNKNPEFDMIEMPEDVKKHYQYFTEADLSNLRNRAGYGEEFFSLEDGIKDYVQNYLMVEDAYL